MPLNVYQCAACQHTIEKIQKYSDQPLKECPACHRQTLSRVISPSNFHLGGSGWYNDGYGTKKSASNTTGETK
ncbi:MAG: hypothetical protein CBD38_04105 [bacterium TMED178]|nr:MAG: hypothetical protein CBD38_04105 [bacterium TMED178]